jgi:hypothetical protein
MVIPDLWLELLLARTSHRSVHSMIPTKIRNLLNITPEFFGETCASFQQHWLFCGLRLVRRMKLDTNQCQLNPIHIPSDPVTNSHCLPCKYKISRWNRTSVEWKMAVTISCCIHDELAVLPKLNSLYTYEYRSPYTKLTKLLRTHITYIDCY